MNLHDRLGPLPGSNAQEARGTEWDVVDAPVEQQDIDPTTPPIENDFSAPGSYVRYQATHDAAPTVNPDVNEVVDAPVEQLEPEPAASQEAPAVDATTRTGRLLQRIANRAENGAIRADKTGERFGDMAEAAKTKLRAIGRVGLRVSKATGTFVAENAAGYGTIAARKGLAVADRADAAFLDAAESAKDSVIEAANKASDKAVRTLVNGMDRVDAGIDSVVDRANAAMERVEAGIDARIDATIDKVVSLKEGAKDFLVNRKNASLRRKAARKALYARTRAGVSSGLDRSAEAAMAAGRKLEAGMDYTGAKMNSGAEAVKSGYERARLSNQEARKIGREVLNRAA